MKIVLTPDWFLGRDVLIDIFSFLVLAVFFYFCYRYYSISKKKNFFYLGLGFALIALAQLATILTKLILYYDTTVTQQIGMYIVTYNVVKSVDIFYYLGFAFQKFLTLLGFYIIYKLPMKKIVPEDSLLAVYFLILSAIVSYQIFFLYHLTILLLLALIIWNYSKIYKENKNKNTLTLIIAFSLLALAHLTLTCSHFQDIYVLGNLIELISYGILLWLIVKLTKDGTTKQ